MFGALQNLIFRHSDATQRSRELGADGPLPDAQQLPCELSNTYDTVTLKTSVHEPVNCTRVRESRAECEIGKLSPLHGLLHNTPEVVFEKQNFLADFGHDYGYGGQLESIRKEDFRRLDGQAYLDYAGAALYSERQVQACCEELLTTLLCNPHSSPAGSPASDALASLRRETLDLLNADGRQYDVVITSGATAALKMVADCFPWRSGASRLAHPVAVHNSVLGMRGPALASGAAVQIVQCTAAAGVAACGGPASSRGACEPAEPGATSQYSPAGGESPTTALATIDLIGPPLASSGEAVAGVSDAAAAAVEPTYSLLVLPAECNFTGDRQPLADVVRHVQRQGIGAYGSEEQPQTCEAGGGADSSGRWLVLLDAAKACATAPPDLAAVPADFVVLSYYKIFGHPTGLGALVARKEALALLAAHKTYFGGGTVEVAVADRPYHVRRTGPPGLEDGTPAFTSIAAARHGFAFLRRLGGLPAVHRHSCCLARWLATRLAALRHANGAPACVLYGRWCAAAAATGAAALPPDEHGPTLSFNLLRPDGGWVGYAEVGRLAAMHGLHLRVGCFCNPGACATWLGLSAEDVIRHHNAGHVCWDDHDLVDGRPTGAVRVSLGAASSFEDVFALLQLVRRYFLDDGGGAGGSCSGGDGTNSGRGSATGPPAAAAAAALPPPLQVREGAKEGYPTAAARATTAAVCKVAEVAERGSSWGTSENVAVAASTAAGAAAAAAAAAPSAAGPSRSQPSVPVVISTTTASPLPGQPRQQASQPGAMPPAAGTPRSGGGQVAARSGASSEPSSKPVPGASVTGEAGRLSRILLYPIKSCAAQLVDAWPIGPTGLLYDREWALVDDSGKVLTLKQCPRMALVRPRVDLTRGTLTIVAPHGVDVPPLELAIPGLFRRRQLCTQGHSPHPEALCHVQADAAPAPTTSGNDAPASSAAVCPAATAVTAAGGGGLAALAAHGSVRLDAGLTTERVQVCGDTVCSDLVDACHDPAGDARVRQWFVRVLGAPCRIVQQRAGARKVRRPTGQGGPAAGAPAPPSSTTATMAAAAAAVATLRQDESSSRSQPHQTQQQQQQQQEEREQQREDGPAGDGRVLARPEERGGPGRDAGSDAQPSVGFANDGQYLLVSEASMQDLRVRLRDHAQRGGAPPSSRGGGGGGCGDGARTDLDDDDDDDLVTRLRPNLVVAGFAPYDEDSWTSVAVGPLRADVLGTCPRCELLQVDPRVGVRRGSEVLVALAQYRRRGGRVQFGVLLAAASAAAGRAGTDAAAPRACGGFAAAVMDPVIPAPGAPVSTVEGPSAAAATEWLRQEFGRYSVVAVGDSVHPLIPEKSGAR